MGPGEQQRTTSRGSEPELDTLARLARLAREDRQWERRMRRRRSAIGAGVVTGLAALTAVVAVTVNRQDSDPVTAPDSSVTASVDGSASALPRASAGGGMPSAASPSASATTSAGASAPTSKARAMYGKPRSGLPWHSGFWTGGKVGTALTERAGTWRGAPMDFATVYPAYGTWEEIRTSSWAVTDFARFKGRLAYGLPLLPKNRKGQWEDILDGSHDEVFRTIARHLVASGHEDAAIRMGVEANGYWFPWAVEVGTVDEYKAAFRRIHKIMSAVSPEFTFWMDINCGTVLTGSRDRLAPLYQMYPGNDVVDGLSMDHYNRYKLLAKDDATWRRAIAPSWAPGFQDGIAFARAHGIGFAVPEWGLDGVQGPGDSPYFMERMWQLFVDSSDVLVFENYFSEADAYIKGDLFQTSQNPRSAAYYRERWGSGAGQG